MRNPDGTATCDGCLTWLPAFGVIHGLVVNGLQDGQMTEWIFCYTNECRARALAGLVLYSTMVNGAPVCTRCGVALGVRGVSAGLLAADLDPDVVAPAQREFTFSYVNDCSATLLAQGLESPDVV